MKFAITGIGLVNGLGSNLETNWQNLLDGKSAIQRVSWPEDPSNLPKTSKSLQINIGAPCPTPEFEENEFDGEHRYWSRNTKLAVSAAVKAYKDSNLQTKDLGCVVTTASGTYETIGKVLKVMDEGRSRFSPKTVLNSSNCYASSAVAKVLGLTGQSSGMTGACSGGLYALDYAMKTLAYDKDTKAMLVGGADTCVGPFTTFYFQNLQALSPDGCRPFDLERNGFVLGEGGAALILERLEDAVARRTRIHGLILGVGMSGVSTNDLNPDAEGTSQIKAITSALKFAGIKEEDIGYINAHATGTPQGDEIEYKLMESLFPNQTMVSNKGQIGHCLPTSGLIESIYTILALRDQMSPPIVGLCDPLAEGMILPTIKTSINTKYALKNNFGFAGRSACAVFARYDGENT